MTYNLIIFDVDGTLSKIDSGRLLPHARAYFTYLAVQWPDGGGPKIALAVNQGGVGLRYWMEKNNFGEPHLYPTQAQAEKHINGVAQEIEKLYAPPAVYISFAYKTKKGRGQWAPRPAEEYHKPAWRRDWRKPAPGMLLAAMADAEVDPDQTLMVGNTEEDMLAAEKARCNYQDKNEFFAPFAGVARQEEARRRNLVLLILFIVGVVGCTLCGLCIVLPALING